jgi:hypothetical protein
VVGLKMKMTFTYSKVVYQWSNHRRFLMDYPEHRNSTRASMPQYINGILDKRDDVKIHSQDAHVPEDDRFYKSLVVDTVITQGLDGVKKLDRIMRDCLHNEDGSTLQVCVAYRLLRMDLMRHEVTGQCRIYMPDQMTLYVQSCDASCVTNERTNSINVKVIRFVFVPSSSKRKMKGDEPHDEPGSDSDSEHCQSPTHVQVSEKRRFVSQTSNTLRHRK